MDIGADGNIIDDATVNRIIAAEVHFEVQKLNSHSVYDMAAAASDVKPVKLD